ncbi:MAG: hypothetical protein ACP5VQ_04455 [Phycisphaerae bacterium]
MFNQLRITTIFSFIIVLSAAILLPSALSFAGLSTAQITSARVQSIQAAQAQLQKEQAADWHAVIAADKAEIVALNAATTAAMKAGNADAVVAAQGLLKTVKTRVAAEKTLTAFPPYFQSASNTTGLHDPALKIETARNKAVAAAVAQAKQAQIAFHDALVAADQNAIAQWKQQISADMKAGKPQAVVADMSAMKQSQQQLQQDSTTAPSVLPAPGMANPNQPAFGPQGMLPHPGVPGGAASKLPDHMMGGALVSVDKVELARVRFTSGGGTHKISNRKYIIVHLGIINTSKSKVINYKTWSGKELFHQAALVDNLGSTCRQRHFGTLSKVQGAVRFTRIIYPRQDVSDVLVFERPVGAATLTLWLPPGNVGGHRRKSFEFRVPKLVAKEVKPAGIPSDQWPKLIKKALKPVVAYSVPSLVAELARYRTDPRKIIGKRVVAFLKSDSTGQLIIGGAVNDAPHLSRQERLQELGIRNQIIEHFNLIRKEARLRRKAEYQYQLGILKSEAPNAMGWQVNQNLLFAEKNECSAVTSAAYSEQRKDLRLVAIAFRSPQDTGEIASPAGVQHPNSGAVYGIVVGMSSRSIARATPALSLPSGSQLRSQVYFKPVQPPYPLPGFLADVSAVEIPSTSIPSCTVYTVKILYCARAPHYLRAKRVVVLGPIKGYVFLMKSGTKMEATTYTTGDFYYHLKWNGIDLTVAKDLVVKIKTVR